MPTVCSSAMIGPRSAALATARAVRALSATSERGDLGGRSAFWRVPARAVNEVAARFRMPMSQLTISSRANCRFNWSSKRHQPQPRVCVGAGAARTRPLPRAPTGKTVPSSASTWLFGDGALSASCPVPQATAGFGKGEPVTTHTEVDIRRRSSPKESRSRPPPQSPVRSGPFFFQLAIAFDCVARRACREREDVC
jgi:hypothetical protein